MSVEQRKVVDAAGICIADGRAVLTIIDPLPWDPDNQHLLVLQNKINDYMECVESGEIYEAYPEARGREIEIQVIYRYPPIGDAVLFLVRADETVRKAGLHFTARSREDIENEIG